MLASVRDANASGAARRRQQRLRQWLRHERLSVAMALAEYNHHSALRRPTMARARGEESEMYNATGQTTPLPRAASTQYFSLGDDEDVLAARPLALDEPRPRVRVLRRTVEQFGDVVPLVPALAVSAPQMVDQLVAVLARYDTPIADQVIEVPKVSCSPRCGRTVLCTPQTAEQLVTVPTILYFLKQTVGTRGRSGGPQGFLPEQRRPSTVEQIVDIPAPGRGVQRGLQGFSQERSSTAFDGAEHRFPAATAEQNVDIPVPGGLSVSGSSSSSAVLRDVRGDAVFRTFPQTKKSATVPPHSGSELPPHSSPWTSAAYDVPMVLEEEEEEEESEDEPDFYVEYVEHDGRMWGCEWVPAHQQYCWWLAAADGSQAGHTIWRPPWLIGSGPG